MSTTQMGADGAAETSGATTVPMKLEVIVLPVADVDRAKSFYASLGWRLDIDFEPAPGARGVQFTPPGSPASIQFGIGSTTAAPGSAQGMILVVDDIDEAREDLVNRGVDVSDVWHLDLGKGRADGPDPEGKSYSNRATFSDPDGNVWHLQQITERLPGRVSRGDVEGLSQLLLDAGKHHDAFEKAAPPHDWWDWYAAYMDARQAGSTQEDSSDAADRYMAEVKHIVKSTA